MLACYALSYLVVSFFANGFSFKFDVEQLTSAATFILFSVLFVSAIAVFLYVLFKSKLIGFKSTIERTDKTNSRMYGDSEWQTEKEIDKNYNKIDWKDIKTVTDAQGFIVSSKIDKEGHLLINRTYEKHALVIAATRVGKTRRFISPNIQYLANCPNKPGLFINDPKGELLAENGANLQNQGYNIFVFNLREPMKSHRYNPLGIVWDFYHEYKKTNDLSLLSEAEALLREIATIIAPVDGKDPTWDLGAQNIIQGLCLAMLEDSEEKKYGMTKEKFTLWQVMSLLSQGSDLLKDFALRRPKTSAAVAKLKNYVDNPAKETIGSYISQTITKLSSYVDIGMTTVMSDTELALNEISAKPYAIFCVVPDENRARHPLAALFASQIYKYLIHLASKNEKIIGVQALPNDFYFLLDEFGNFPRMDCIQEMLSIGAGRKIWTCIVIQALGQLHAKYGKEITSTLLNNLHLQLYMGAPELETNKFFSEFIGYRTVRKNSVSLTSADITKDLSGSTQMEKSALINPDELARLQPGEIVFKIFKDQPVKTKLVHFYDKEMQQKGYFVAGRPNIQFNSKPFNRDVAFYDLVDRDNNYDNLNNASEIEEITDEFLSSEPKLDIVSNNSSVTSGVNTTNQSTIDFINTIKKKI